MRTFRNMAGVLSDALSLNSGCFGSTSTYGSAHTSCRVSIACQKAMNGGGKLPTPSPATAASQMERSTSQSPAAITSGCTLPPRRRASMYHASLAHLSTAA